MRALFAAFEKTGTDGRATKGRLVEKMIELPTVHTYIENEVMYPSVRFLLPELEDDVLESYEAHHVAVVLVSELYAMSSSDERFTAKTTVLIKNVRPHGGRGTGLVPEGAGGSGAHAPSGDRCRDDPGPGQGTESARAAQRAQEDHRRGHRLIPPRES